jgi:hypothetical protein
MYSTEQEKLNKKLAGVLDESFAALSAMGLMFAFHA